MNDSHMHKLCDGLAECTSLLSLNLSCNELTNASVKRFTEVALRTYIEELVLSKNELHNSGAHALSQLIANPECKIKSLDISKCEFQYLGGLMIFRSLAYSSSLMRSLNMSDNNFSLFSQLSSSKILAYL